MPPPQFYPPPVSGYPGYPPPAHGYPGYPPPAYPGYPPPTVAGPPPGHATRPPPLAINSENRRGPRGANLAIFCLPNAWGDQEVFDLAKPHGTPIFCSVAVHRDTGMSRGYAFVSFDSVEEADKVKANLHDQVVEGRALRCELTRQDKEAAPGGAKPY